MNLLAQTSEFNVTIEGDGLSAGVLLLWLALIVVSVVAMWKVFEKAGREGWKAIIPFYNIWVLFEIAGREGWWMFLMLIPFVNLVVSVVLALDLAKAFGKSAGFGIVALWLFSFIGYLILGFGDAEYQLDKPGGGTPSEPAPQAPAAA